MASPLVCVVYVYEQFIQHHYIILSTLLTVEKWQLDGRLTDAASVCVCMCVYQPLGKEGRFRETRFFLLGHKSFPSEPHK